MLFFSLVLFVHSIYNCAAVSTWNTAVTSNEYYSDDGFFDVYEYVCKHQSIRMRLLINCENHEIKVSSSFCLAYSPTSNESHHLYFGRCPFWEHRSNKVGFTLPLNITDVSTFNEQVMCKQVNRTGVLCGQCDDSFGISLNSLTFECIPDEHCHGYNWLFFIMAHLAPVTLLFILVIFFDIKLTSGYAYSYILFSQVITLQTVDRLYMNSTDWFYTLLMTFYSIWSLDVGRINFYPLCTSKTIDALDAIALQYIPVYYSLFLVFLTYCLVVLYKYDNCVVVRIWRPFSYCFNITAGRDMSSLTVITKTFAVFLLLSFSKLLATSVMLLRPTFLFNVETGKLFKTVYFYDGTVNYFGNARVILLNLFAIFTLIVFIILPSFLLLFYPMRRFRRVLEYLKLDRPGLVTFVNSFQECYKDGTNGTRDCRWFSAAYFLLRMIPCVIDFSLIYSSINFTVLLFLFLQGLMILMLLLVVIVFPYKRRLYNQLDITLLLLSIFILSLAIIQYDSTHERHNMTVNILLMISFMIPFIGAVLYIGYHTVMKLIVCTRLSVKAWYNMRRVQNRSDDIDSFVQDKATVSQDLTTDHTDLTPSLPDRLIHPSSYKDEEDTFVCVNYGSTNQDN